MHSSQNEVCKYFKNGNCKFGNRCHNLHTSSTSTTRPQNSSGPSSYNVYTSNRFSQINPQPMKTDYSQPGSFSSKIRQNSNEQVSNSFATQKVSSPVSNPITQSQHMGSITGSSSQKIPFSSVQFASKSNPMLHTPPHSSVSTESVYSRMSDLTSDEVTAFKAQSFVIGKIPIKPPPKELCQ